MDRRDFFKKAGMVGGLGAAGALTLKKGYIKPVIRALEPSYAEAQTPMVQAGSIVMPTSPLNVTQNAGAAIPGPAAFNIRFTLEVAGVMVAGAGAACNAAVDLNVTATNEGVATGPYIQDNATTNAGLAGVAVTNASGQLNFGYAQAVPATLNAVALTAAPGPGTALGTCWLDAALGGDYMVLGTTPTITAQSVWGIDLPLTTLPQISIDLYTA